MILLWSQTTCNSCATINTIIAIYGPQHFLDAIGACDALQQLRLYQHFVITPTLRVAKTWLLNLLWETWAAKSLLF